jgi:type IV/VI secretion system ImpK/VasF family protein
MIKIQPVVTTTHCPILLTPRTQQHLVQKPLQHAPIHHNPLLAEASKVFTLIARLSNQTKVDSKKFQNLLFSELANFEEKIKWSHDDEDLAFAVCYALNICVDEMIHTYCPGKKRSSTQKQTSANDQQRFSSILEQMCQEPQKFIDSIELIYICLNLRYGTKHNSSWQQITDNMYQIIRSQRGEVEKRLSFLMPQMTIHSSMLKNKSTLFPIFEAFLITSFILFGMYSGTDYLFKLCSTQFSQDLQSVIKNANMDHSINFL